MRSSSFGGYLLETTPEPLDELGGGRSLGGDTTYTAFVRAPLNLSTSMSSPLPNGIRLQPFRRKVCAKRRISLLKIDHALRSFSARLPVATRLRSDADVPPAEYLRVFELSNITSQLGTITSPS